MHWPDPVGRTGGSFRRVDRALVGSTWNVPKETSQPPRNAAGPSPARSHRGPPDRADQREARGLTAVSVRASVGGRAALRTSTLRTPTSPPNPNPSSATATRPTRGSAPARASRVGPKHPEAPTGQRPARPPARGGRRPSRHPGEQTAARGIGAAQVHRAGSGVARIDGGQNQAGEALTTQPVHPRQRRASSASSELRPRARPAPGAPPPSDVWLPGRCGATGHLRDQACRDPGSGGRRSGPGSVLSRRGRRAGPYAGREPTMTPDARGQG